jgi:hypothetical protein
LIHGRNLSGAQRTLNIQLYREWNHLNCDPSFDLLLHLLLQNISAAEEEIVLVPTSVPSSSVSISDSMDESPFIGPSNACPFVTSSPVPIPLAPDADDEDERDENENGDLGFESYSLLFLF